MPLELEHVSYTYAAGTSLSVQALADVSLRVNEGEFVGIAGRTGCGKTTLIQLLAGLIAPTGGRVLLDGADINAPGYDKRQLRSRVGLVFQFPEYQLFETTVEKDVAFALKHSGLSRRETQERVRKALETVGFDFEAVRRQSPLALSGGEKRRVAIAGVLAAEPRLLIFDEPVAGLDPMGRRDFLELAARLNRQGATILMISHNADSLAEYAHRLIVLREGQLALDEPIQAAFADLERARGLGLGVSQARQVIGLLADRGVVLSPDIVTYDALLDAIEKHLKGGASA